MYKNLFLFVMSEFTVFLNYYDDANIFQNIKIFLLILTHFNYSAHYKMFVPKYNLKVCKVKYCCISEFNYPFFVSSINLNFHLQKFIEYFHSILTYITDFCCKTFYCKIPSRLCHIKHIREFLLYYNKISKDSNYDTYFLYGLWI